MTRARFLAAYRGAMFAAYDWARDMGKLDRFMIEVEKTLKGEAHHWQASGAVLESVWTALGGSGRVTLGKLQALPD